MLFSRTSCYFHEQALIRDKLTFKYCFSYERIELLAVKYQLDDYQALTCRITNYRKSMIDIWQLHEQNVEYCMSNEHV